MKLPAIALTLVTASAAFAQNLYLDPNGTASGAGLITSLEWNNAIWSTSSGGTIASSNWTAGAVANISAGSGEVGTRILNIATDVQISGLVARNEAVNVNTTGGSLINSGNLSVSGSYDIQINANINIGAHTLTYDGTSTLTLSGANTLSHVVLNSGAIKVQGSDEALGTGRVTINGGTLDFAYANPTATVISGQITRAYRTDYYTGTVVSGANAITNNSFSSATVILSDSAARLETNNYGHVVIDAGTLQAPNTGSTLFFNDITNHDGMIAVHNSGQTKTYNISGDLNLTDGLFTPFETTEMIDGRSTVEMLLSSSGHSFLNITGAAHLAGDLVVIGDGYFGQGEEITFDLIDAGSIHGGFSSVTLPTLFEGFAWDTSQLYTTGSISITAIPETAAFALIGSLASLLFSASRRRYSTTAKSNYST